jgi:serpin B
MKRQRPDSPNHTSPLVSAINRFGFDLLQKLIGGAPAENLLIAPASIAAALAMTYNGAGGDTARAMAGVLGVNSLRLAEVNQAHAALWADLAQADPLVTFAAANSLWASLGIPFLPDFMQRNREFYQAEVANLNFSDPQAVPTINAWVGEQTHGKITEIVSPPINPLAILFLINALYFKGQWRQQFDRAATRPGVFHGLAGQEQPCDLMRQSGKFRYLAGPDFQAISLPYGAGRFSLYVFLPAVKVGLAGFLARWLPQAADRWHEWMREFREQDGVIALPRLKIACSKSLNAALKALGMAIAFDATAADFSAMCPGATDGLVFIADVRHKTFMEVNEEGTVAAAVTKVEMWLRSLPPPPFEMLVDRPFFCAIRDDVTGAILFAGIVVSPE